MFKYKLISSIFSNLRHPFCQPSDFVLQQFCQPISHPLTTLSHLFRKVLHDNCADMPTIGRLLAET